MPRRWITSRWPSRTPPADPYLLDTEATLDPAKLDSMYEADCAWKAEVFPNYYLPHRGLPAEIRLMIWRHCFSETLNVERFASIHGTGESDKEDEDEEYRILTSRDPWTKWGMIANGEDFNLNIFLLDKGTRAEAVASTKGTVVWKFGQEMGGPNVRFFFWPWTPFLRHITRAIDITMLSLKDSHYDYASSSRKYRSVRDIIGCDYFDELILRTIPDRTGCGSRPGQLFVPFDPDHPNTPVAHHDLNLELLWNGWTEDLAHTVYRLLTTGQVAVVKLVHSHAYEGQRSFFSAAHAELFNNRYHGGYRLSEHSDDIRTLKVELDWPLGSSELVISITKKRFQFR